MKHRWVLIGTTIVVLIIFIGGVAVHSMSKNLPNKQPKSQNTLNLKNQPFLGKEESPVTIVEFADYRCPWCKKFEDQVVPKIRQNLVNTGKAKFYFINFTVLGDNSKVAANAADYIYTHYPDGFWAFHDALYLQQKSEEKNWITKKLLIKTAEATVPGLNKKDFAYAIDHNTYLNKVKYDNKLAEKADINETPTVLVNGKKIKNLGYESLFTAVNAAE